MSRIRAHHILVRTTLQRYTGPVALQLLKIVEHSISDVEYELQQFVNYPSYLTHWLKNIADNEALPDRGTIQRIHCSSD